MIRPDTGFESLLSGVYDYSKECLLQQSSGVVGTFSGQRVIPEWDRVEGPGASLARVEFYPRESVITKQGDYFQALTIGRRYTFKGDEVREVRRALEFGKRDRISGLGEGDLPQFFGRVNRLEGRAGLVTVDPQLGLILDYYDTRYMEISRAMEREEVFGPEGFRFYTGLIDFFLQQRASDTRGLLVQV